MSERKDKAVELHKSGYNCAQSVLGAYADLMGMDAAQAFSLAAPFGGGLAGMRHVCGTVSAMAMIAGLSNGTTEAGDKEGRKRCFNDVKALSDSFALEHGSIICRQLRGLEPGLPEGKLPKPCTEYVRTSAALIEEYLKNKK